MASNESWEKIFKDHGINDHDFNKSPFTIDSKMIKESTQVFKKTAQKEVRLLCKQDSRKDRPQVFIDNGLFLLPIKNGVYSIIKGEGYIDIPKIDCDIEKHESILDFCLDTSKTGDSEMQHLDYAYATSLIRTFMNDNSLVLTIRGRKYTPKINFNVGKFSIYTESVQTEVDAGYEGKKQVVLIEAKNSKTKDTIIRQLYYPFRQWQKYTDKKVVCLFFERDKKTEVYNIWQFEFTDINNYNSISLVRTARYKIICKN